MSLKKIVLTLLIANLGYFAYSLGWLSPLLGSDTSQREPERVTRQVNPAAIEVAIATIVPSMLPEQAVQAPPPVEPASSQPATCTSQREQWMVYMGPYASKALSEKKKAELKALGLTSTPASKPSLKLGLSLGQFESEILAREALARFASQGVKTATVVLWGTTSCP